MSSHEVTSDTRSTGKSVVAVIFGFIICAVLAYIAMYIVEHKSMDYDGLISVVSVLAVLQLLAQIFLFLRLNSRTAEGKWNMWTFIFTILIIAIIFIGTLWIMYNLNYYMVH